MREAELFRAHGLPHEEPPRPVHEERDPHRPPSIFDDPVWRQIDQVGGHWFWRGPFGPAGPRMVIDGQAIRVDRHVYGLCEGWLDAEHDLRNVCGLRRCVFPAHATVECAGDEMGQVCTESGHHAVHTVHALTHSET